MDNEHLVIEETIESWVIGKVQKWREHYEANYSEKHDEYYRLWRGIWSAEDRTRESERSKIISPALQQAVESAVAEVEEATFGRGRWFDVEDNKNDGDNSDVQYLRNKLLEDFKKRGIRRDVSECLINAAVFGTGIAEVVLEDISEQRPGTEPIMDGQLQAVGVNISERTVVTMRPIMPKQFLIDPVATSVDNAMGCAVDEFVSAHHVDILQEKGVYKNTSIRSAAPDFDIEPDEDLTVYQDDKVRLTKYYGLVPRDLLEKEVGETEGDSYYAEAIVVIGNEGALLKAEENPYMMGDRPIIAFPWDIVPGRFWGRGICEKGYNSQKALDAELRARIDALALTVHPMMAIDATRLPRGHKPEVRPGKILLTNGDPKDVLNPFNFGNVSQITFSQAAELQKMVQMATGAIDSAGITGAINGEAAASAISMSLGAVIKRHKRTLINFQESFLIPFAEKAAWRYMQFDPENYPVNDYNFIASSSLGIMAREYEVTQLVQLLQTMSPDSPIYPALIESIIENMNLSNREDLIKTIRQASQPTPEQQQAAQRAAEREEQAHQAQVGVLDGQRQESLSRARKYNTEAEAVPKELEIRRLQVITTNLKDGDKEDREFERRYKIADLLLKEKAQEQKSKEAAERRAAKQKEDQASDALMRKLNV